MSRAYPNFLAEGHVRGLCLAPDVDPDLFVADGDRGLARNRRIEKAKAICRRCEHCEACGLWAYRTHQTGVWGGTTTSERDEMRTGRATAA